MADLSLLARTLSIQQEQENASRQSSATKRNTVTSSVMEMNNTSDILSKGSSSHNYHYGREMKRNINTLPEKLLIKIFQQLTPKEVMKCSYVCKSWRNLTQNPRVWRLLRLRPGFNDSLHLRNFDHFMYLLSHRISLGLEYIELPIEFITTQVLHELANKCNYLSHLTLDFSTAMQLRDFNDLSVFPCNLKSLTMCLSDVIFLEGFMRRIYSNLTSLEQLKLIGTIETSSDMDESHETLNIIKLRTFTPNLRIINFYGVTFIEDQHLEAIATSCIHLECLALSYCYKYKGYSLKFLIDRCKKMKTLLLQNTSIEDKALNAVEWQESSIQELDLTSTDLSEETLTRLLLSLRKIKYLSVAYCDGFTDKLLLALEEMQKLDHIEVLDLGNTVNISGDAAYSFVKQHGHQLKGFAFTGNQKVTEEFWSNSIPHLSKIRVLLLGTANGWFKRITARIHINLIMESLALNCQYLERLEIQWDPSTIRFNENSQKSVDQVRLKCPRLKSLVLTDGAYYEMVKSNFERADRLKLVRTTASYLTSTVCLVSFYSQLLFN